MNDYVIVAFKIPRDQAQAYLTVFPNAKIIEKPAKLKEETLAPPTVNDVLAFCRERNSPVDGARFFAYYNDRGWIDNAGKPVTNWKQRLIDWENNGRGNQKKSPYQVTAKKEFRHRKEDIDNFFKWCDEIGVKHEESQSGQA